jgi:radical SAM superfamily enzyme YgiQ (UPF0313 family)
MKKILLIQPPFAGESIGSLIKYAPMGLIAVAAYLRAQIKDLEIKIYDANVEEDSSLKNIVNYILADQPQILGLTGMTTNINAALEIATAIKANKPEIIIVVGGIHCTVLPSEVLAHPAVDFIVIGEGEITAAELVKNIDQPQNFKNIAGLGYKENGQIFINRRRELIQNIDELPIPAYDLLKIDKYHSAYAQKKPFISMLRSRGCPYRCIFCGVQNMFGRIFRVQSPERTIKEIDYLREKFQIKEIGFKDSEFTINLPNLIKFCDLLIEKKYELVWSCNARVDRTDVELYKKMAAAGCHTVSFGIESGDQNILEVMKKDINLEQARQAVKAAQKAGIKASAGFIIGTPQETKETIEKTIEFAKKINPDYVAFSFATPFPGTELRALAEKNNWLLTSDFNAVTYTDLIMNATDLPNEELKKYMKKAYRSFYFRPRYILKRLTKLNKTEIKNSFNGLIALLKNYILKK